MRITRSQRLIASVAAVLLLAPTAVAAHHRPDHHVPPGHERKAPDPDPTEEPTEDPVPTPADYTAIQGLSQPDFPQTARESFRVPMSDGVELYVEVVRPDPAAYPEAGDRWPVILEASPYHGTLADREGIRVFPDPRDASGKPIGLTGYFAPRGYAVVMADLRGTGRSTGCLDHLGPKDASDLKAIVEWAASQPWSDGRVGMTGHSYVGSTPSVAAAQEPEGLVTIVPSAGLTSMYDHQFQKGVPWLLQWVGPQVAYPWLSTARHLPPGTPDLAFGATTGDYYGEEPQTVACGWQESALTAGHGQVTGQYQEWHAERDWREQATDVDIPVFMVHGVKDNAARIPAADWFFADRGGDADDKVWIGQWDHGSSNGNTICAAADRATGHVNCRFAQWQYALHAWFDKHLQQRDVDTGPPVEAFLNGKRVWTANSWEDTDDRLELAAGGDGTLTDEEPQAGEHAYTSYAFQSVVTIGGQPQPQRSQEIVFTSEPVTEQTLLVGSPSVRLRASVSNPNGTHLIATVYRQAANGSREAMTYCAIQPQFRDGVDDPQPVVPGEAMDLEPSCFTMAHVLNPGERIVLGVGAWSPHHVSSFAQDARVTVYSGPDATAVDLPVRPGATVYDDTALD